MERTHRTQLTATVATLLQRKDTEKISSGQRCVGDRRPGESRCSSPSHGGQVEFQTLSNWDSMSEVSSTGKLIGDSVPKEFIVLSPTQPLCSMCQDSRLQEESQGPPQTTSPVQATCSEPPSARRGCREPRRVSCQVPTRVSLGSRSS